MTNRIVLALAAAFALGMPALAHASVDLVNGQGATAPCTGFGPIGGPAAEHCGVLFEQQGFVRDAAVGSSGLTIGTSGPDDGVVTQVAPGSPAALAGMRQGDVIVSVEGHAAKSTPGQIAAERIFGLKGDKIAVTVSHNGASHVVPLTLVAEPAPPAPRWDGFLVANKALINWKGDFIPCVGVGPLAPAAILFCVNHFKPYGFVDVGQMGGSGLGLDMTRVDAATISTVQAGSPGALAGIAPGDQILAVGDHPLEKSIGEVAKEEIFGKAGDVRHLTVRRGGVDSSIILTLAPSHK